MNPIPSAKVFHMSRLLLIPTLALIITGCGADAHQDHDDHNHGTSTAAATAPDPHAGHDHGAASAATDPHAGHNHGAEGIALTATVRENLGITFVKSEYRIVQNVLRLPGRFESEPTARQAYQMPLSGQVEVLVKPFQRVAIGDALYQLASADWHALQQRLAEASVAADLAAERYAAAQAHVAALDQAITLWKERSAILEQLAKEIGGKATELAEAKGRVADLLVQQVEAQTHLAELKREAQGADGKATGGLAAIRLQQALATTARITGIESTALSVVTNGQPLWQTIDQPIVTARAAGVVEGEIATSGTWLDQRGLVMTITDPSGVRFRAQALQADIHKLKDGMTARIVGTDPNHDLRLPVHIVLAPIADAIDRSVDLIARPNDVTQFPAEVRPGVVALLEVAINGSSEEELAIPVGATIRDGLKVIFFKRNRTNTDVVEKVEADLGPSDGRWVVVRSGLKEGDEVVVGGVYPLKLSQQEGGAQAGHFEADGTFHTGSH